MVEDSYYVYALKDPRNSKPFYIGKGTGIRAWDHDISIDSSRKGKRIMEIKAEGHNVIITKLISNLSEMQALKLEAELIAAFGIEEYGGLLTNSVIPSGKTRKSPKNLRVPMGIREKAQLGLSMLKDAVMELAQANASGITNSEAVKALGLESDYRGQQKDYLSYSIIGILMREGRLKREPGSSRRHLAQVR